MAMSAEHRSFNINGDVSIWVKNSWVGRKTQIYKKYWQLQKLQIKFWQDMYFCHYIRHRRQGSLSLVGRNYYFF